MKRNRNNSLFDRTLLRQSLRASFQKLDPRKMVKNPIIAADRVDCRDGQYLAGVAAL